MVQIHKEYERLGVVFLGFTTRNLDQADAFTNSFSITWPNQYGVRSLVLAAPVIYIIGRDGRIVWSDERSRYRHDVEHLRRDMEEVLDQELSQATSGPSPRRDEALPSRDATPRAAG